MTNKLAAAGVASYILFLLPLIGSQFLDLSADSLADLFFFLFAPAALAAITPSFLKLGRIGAVIAPAIGGAMAYFTNHLLSAYWESISLNYSDIYYSVAYPLGVGVAIILSAVVSLLSNRAPATEEGLKVEVSEKAEVREEETMVEEKRKAEAELMSCPHCGQQIPSDSIYCPLCGGKVKEE